MIVGIGVDIAETARFEKLSSRYGARFARRILTDDELVEFDRRRQSNNYLATRFAAKEAAAKALGTGIGEHFGFHSIQVDNNEQGQPQLRFIGNATKLVSRLKIRNAMISLSDEKHYVVAMVVLES